MSDFRFLSAEEVKQLAGARGVSLDAYFSPVIWRKSEPQELPVTVSRRVFWCRVLWLSICCAGEDEMLVWTDARDLVPESEHLPLVEVWMRGLGALDDPNGQPGIVCAGSAVPHGLSLLLLSLLFGWDCWAVNLRTLQCAHLSHDDWCLVAHLDPGSSSEWIAETVQELRL